MGVLNPLPFFRLSVFFLIFLISTNHSLTENTDDESGNINTIANSTNLPPPPPPPVARQNTAAFKPSIAIIVGILTTIFSITFLLLLYVKHCKRPSINSTNSRGLRPTRENSGVNRKVIESLPLFRFSSLRGQKDGLECAVCLNKFDPEEVLRLLPKCKHAFHVECVDTWLDAHSTCPLCRYRVDPEDVLLIDSNRALYNHSGDQITPRNSDNQGKGNEFVNPRVSGRHSSAGERGSSLEIIVENPGRDFRGRSSFDSWNSKRKTGRRNGKENGSISENLRSRSLDSWKVNRKDGQLPVQGDNNNNKHRLEHRIIISGGEEEEGRRRWSDVQAADFLYLKTEMILLEEGGSGRGVINERSVSEITGMSRYRDNNGGERGRERQEEEGVVKRWLDWISQSHQQQQKTAVPSPKTSSSSPSSNSIVV
ncbi:hypothetical protein ACJIZ3_025657 [Penstemon smallii]|uniref:RING-type E3 ubiquitin transferase n=1 Tax=Penstemon smallii TaxID=265156 RepID=A0ABD3TWX6_9LAMI